MNKLLEIFESLHERFKEDSKFRLCSIAVVGFTIIVGASFWGEDDAPYRPKERISNKPKSMFVSDESAAELDQDNIESTYKALQRESAKMEENSTGLYTKWKNEKEELMRENDSLKQDMQTIKRQVKLLSSQSMKNMNTSPAPRETNTLVNTEQAITTATNKQVGTNGAQQTVQPIYRKQNTNIITTSPVVGRGLRIISQSKETLVNGSGTKTTLKGEALANQNKLDKTKTTKEVEKEKPFWLPAGSMITGVMITGVNAATHPSASSQPEPVNIRITEDVIMPGGYTVDLKGCTVIGGAVGSLKDNRAKIRSELISCIREDGKAIEVNLMAYASGSDGLQGIKGKRVSLAAPIITTSILAGVAGGFAQSMAPQQIQGLQTSNSTETLFQRPKVGEVTGMAALNGVSRSFGRAEEYFMDLADQMAPYIEVQAGRRIELTTQKGVSLQIKS